MLTGQFRLFKAAKRTFKAEGTFVLFTIVITSWSIFALYKLSIGSEKNSLAFSLSPPLLGSIKPATHDHNPSTATPTKQTIKPDPSQSATSGDILTIQTTTSKPINPPFTSQSELNTSPKLLQIINSFQAKAEDLAHVSPAGNQDEKYQLQHKDSGSFVRPSNRHDLAHNGHQNRDEDADSHARESLAKYLAESLNRRQQRERQHQQQLIELSRRIQLSRLLAESNPSQRPMHLATTHQTTPPEQYLTSQLYQTTPPAIRLMDETINKNEKPVPPELPADYKWPMNSNSHFWDPRSAFVETTKDGQDKSDRLAQASNQDFDHSVTESINKVAPNSSTKSPPINDDVDDQEVNDTDDSRNSNNEPEDNPTGDDKSGADNESNDMNSADETTTIEPADNRKGDNLPPGISEDEQQESAARETGRAVDDELDRMTQPNSSAVVDDKVQLESIENNLEQNDRQQADDSDSNNTNNNDDIDSQMQVDNNLTTARVPSKTNASDTNHLDESSDDGTESQTPLETTTPAAQVDIVDSISKLGDQSDLDGGSESRVRNLKRLIGSSSEKIRAPYEIDRFLNRLDFGGRKRKKRQTDPLIPKTSNESMKRQDFYTQLGDPNVKGYDFLNNNRLANSLSYSEQERLTRELSKSKLPPPGDLQSAPGARYTMANQSVLTPNANHQLDHQPESSLFTVDHGLLLYPAAGHQKHEGYSSKKKKKHQKSKHKHKLSIGYKKGGHKNKKHKKEEKKFIKEKKFKGAKKGKKIKKGKGGQGGKKGKKKFKDKGYKKKGFKNVYHKEEFGQKKSYFDEFRDKDFKKKWKKYDDNYKYAQMKKWQAKDVKGAKKTKDHGEKFKKYDKSRWKKKYEKEMKEHKASASKKKMKTW